jgi:putative DNA-invertase from lambdoid prophage Rac
VRLFFDHNLSPAMARAFGELFRGEHVVATLAQKFRPNTPDVEWISSLSAEGNWVIISGDRRITRNRAEYAAFRNSRLIGLFLSPGLYKSKVILASYCPQGYAPADDRNRHGITSVWLDLVIRTGLSTDNTLTDEGIVPMATILYARVSTVEQTAAHQRTQAEAAGFQIDDVIADHGVSGITTRLVDREQGRRLFDKLRAGDTLVVRWVDRLGRNYADVTDTIREFMRRGVVIRTVINAMTFDGATKDPMQQAVRDALIAFMAATAQAQAEASKEAQRAGIAHARETKDHVYLGRRPSYNRQQVTAVTTMLANGVSISEIARSIKLSRQVIYRIKDAPAEVEALLVKWERRAA